MCRYAPHYMYQGTLYPNYLSGTGYIMSRDVVLRLYHAALKTPLFHLEDVYLTGLCAHAAGIRPRHHPAFTYNKRKLDACLYKDKTVITSHRVNSSELRKVSSLSKTYVILKDVAIGTWHLWNGYYWAQDLKFSLWWKPRLWVCTRLLMLS